MPIITLYSMHGEASHKRRGVEIIFGMPREQRFTADQRNEMLARLDLYNLVHKRPGQHGGPIPRAARDAFAVLLRRCGVDTGLRFPSWNWFETMAGISRATVHRALKLLARLGFIKIIPRWVRNPGGAISNTSNGYEFLDVPADGDRTARDELIQRRREAIRRLNHHERETRPQREAEQRARVLASEIAEDQRRWDLLDDIRAPAPENVQEAPATDETPPSQNETPHPEALSTLGGSPSATATIPAPKQPESRIERGSGRSVFSDRWVESLLKKVGLLPG